MRQLLLIVGALATASLTGACSKSEPANLTTASGVIAAWDDADLEMGTFAPADDVKVAGGECQQGTVDALDVIVCEYSSEDAAKRAQKAGLRQVGAATGLALASGPLLLVVTDREGVDPSGKTINNVTRVFRGQSIDD